MCVCVCVCLCVCVRACVRACVCVCVTRIAARLGNQCAVKIMQTAQNLAIILLLVSHTGYIAPNHQQFVNSLLAFIALIRQLVALISQVTVCTFVSSNRGVMCRAHFIIIIIDCKQK